MKNKVVKAFVAIVLITIMILMQLQNIALAGLIDNAQGESGYSPPPPTPPDDPPTTIDPPDKPTKPSGPQTVTIPHYTSISGNVYEDLGYSKIPSGGQDSSNSAKMAISGIKVKLLNSSGQVVSEQTTGANGSYHFSPSPGTYTVELEYGNIDGANLNNTELIKNILKYNGHDYITVQTPEDQEYLNVEKVEIQQGGKGVAQVFLAVDCSAVMRTTRVDYNGEKKSRLEVVAEAAKELINTLISSGDNIYVGLVFFSGTCYRAVSLTKNKELLNEALDNIVVNGWQTPNTDMVAAFDKVYESFYNNSKNDSNRYMVVLSDGIPTKAGSNLQTYRDMSESEIMSTLEKVKTVTKNKLNQVKNSGVKVFSLMVKSDDQEENDWAADIFDKPASDVFYSTQDGIEMANTIKENLQEYITESTEEKEYSSSGFVIAGYEDPDRRKEVDDNFKDVFYYGNTIMFSQIQNYNASQQAKEQAKELSEKTWMKVRVGTYSIDSIPSPDTEYVYGENEEGESEVVKIIRHVAASYSGQDVVLAKRPTLSLRILVTAKALKITLSDNRILTTKTVEPESMLPLIEYMDEEIAHGATIEIEYQIDVKNDSNVQCNYLELINYLPEGFLYSENTRLITENKTNKDYNWKQASVSELNSKGYISDEVMKNHSGKRVVISQLGDPDNPSKDFYISPGGQYTANLVVSKTISSLDNLVNGDEGIEDTVEVLAYKNSANRRMAYLQNVTSGNYFINWLIGVYPGDGEGSDSAPNATNPTNKVTVIPPTGVFTIDEKNAPKLLLTFTIPLILVLLLLIRKKRK